MQIQTQQKTVTCPKSKQELFTRLDNGTEKYHCSFGKCRTCDTYFAEDHLYITSTGITRWPIQFIGAICLECPVEMDLEMKALSEIKTELNDGV